MAGEATIMASLAYSFKFYHTIFHSFKLLNTGIEAISDKDFSLNIRPVGQPDLDKLIGVFNKMIEQLRLERTVAAEKNFFLEKLIDASPAAIIILGKNNEVLNINPSAFELLEIPNGNKPHTIEELPTPWSEELDKLESGSELLQLNGIYQYKVSKSFFVDRGVKQSFFLIEEMTREIWRAERQSYEKVIRLMSHEVNNSVGSVNSIIESSVLYLETIEDDGLEDFTKALKVAAERIVNLNLFTKRFADIVRLPMPDTTQCNLKQIVGQVIILFQNNLQDNQIKAIHEQPEQDINIMFDQQQLELVLVNIIKNAIEAIDKNGEIKIGYNLSPLTLIIANNGEPIPTDVQKKLFEPFITTKKTGQGIGLTLIRDILTNHNCRFSLHTNNEGITEFKILFQQ